MTTTTGGPLHSAVQAIHAGDVDTLTRLLEENPDLVSSRLSDASSRTLLHAATDWPGHFPNGAAAVVVLCAFGADVNAPARGSHSETALHWAASSDDVTVLDALLDAGADIDAPGAVVGGATPLADATAFGQWRAARRLVERGAHTRVFDEAALGLLDRLQRRFAEPTPPSPDEVNVAFWAACHGNQRSCAEYLLERGADPNALPGWERRTPLDAAERSHADDLAVWLRNNGARSAGDLNR